MSGGASAAPLRRPVRSAVLVLSLLSTLIATGDMLLRTASEAVAPVLGLHTAWLDGVMVVLLIAGAAAAMRRPRWSLLFFTAALLLVLGHMIVLPSVGAGYWCAVLLVLAALAGYGTREAKRERLALT
jgi:hypothetical protein